MSQYFLTTFCVNDQHGEPIDKCHGIDIGSIVASLEPKYTDFAPKFTWRGERSFRIHRREFQAVAYRPWVGNLLWDAFWITPETAAELLNRCRTANCWTMHQGHSEIFEAWRDGRDILASDLMPALPRCAGKL